MGWSRVALLVAATLFSSLRAQVIEFEQNGLRYQTLTKNGVTIMISQLPAAMKEYAVFQVAVANGSGVAWTIKPEDFTFRRKDGTAMPPVQPSTVVYRMLERGGRNEVIKLVSTYELALYGLARVQSSSGYEKRRQEALAEVTSARLKAAAAASAIAFVTVKLTPGLSTDGAIFYPITARPLGPGFLTVRAAGETFEFASLGTE